MKKQLLCIGLPTWEGDYIKSTVQLMKALAPDYDILYVEYAFTWLDVWRGLRGKADVPVRRIVGMTPRLRKIELENNAILHVLTLPPFLPTNWLSPKWHDWMFKWNVMLTLYTLRPILKQLKFDNPLVMNAFQPGLGLGLKGKLEEQLLLYYCYDAIGAASWIGKHGARLEKAFLPLADIVITTSEHLQKEKSIYNKNCHVVKNGVDIKQFLNINAKNPIKNTQNYKHLIGYIGSVDERLDYNLLCHAISKMPDCLFVFVGRVMSETGKNSLQQFDNVQLVGSKPPAELPAYVQQFDVGLIPFVKNELTVGIYPMKINEYLILGKPAVATDFADLQDFKSVISISRNPAEFVQAIQENVQSEQSHLSALRRELALQNTWENRALAFKNLIETSLEKR